tara:strand:- start:327 stop:512 length:186 start_codon:yes stop_codon:yes gene_type:complete
MKNFETNNEVSKEEVIKQSLNNMVIAKRALNNLLELDTKVEDEEREMIEEIKEKAEKILKK